MSDPRTAAELNAIIARWMGWIEHDCKWFRWEAPADHRMHADPPAYASDLNVWEEVWPILEERNVGAEMEDALVTVIIDELVEEGAEDNGVGALQMAMSTARQRAEALVKVIEEADRG